VSTKITEVEYQTFKRLAHTQSVSEWIRGVLHERVAQRDIEDLLLAEVLALRTILLNLHFALSTGAPPSADTMREWIDRADEDRFRKAEERRAAAAMKRPW
jgi:hypothetical protein